jgi:molybdopterin-guanine dinucleotide biosynthesis protein A
MGSDKALLALNGEPMLMRTIRVLREVVEAVYVVGPPERYEKFGYLVIPDEVPGAGPLGGIITALASSKASWNLVVACDMPGLAPAPLRQLIEKAMSTDADCCLAVTGGNLPEPLCAVYHQRALPAMRKAFEEGIRKCTSAFEGLKVAHWPVAGESLVANLNTPSEWQAYAGGKKRVSGVG